MLQVGPDGASLQQLKELCDSLGLRVSVYSASPEQCKHVSLPAIVYFDNYRGSGGHFQLLVGLDDDEVRLIDGTTATLDFMTVDDFRRRWSGYLLATSGPFQWRTFFSLLAGLSLAAAIGFVLVSWSTAVRRCDVGAGRGMDSLAKGAGLQ